MNESQQADMLRGAKIAADEFGLYRLQEHCIDAVAALRHKDDLINRLLDKNEALRKQLEPAAA